MLMSFTDWNAVSIDDRQALLSRLTKEIWKIEQSLFDMCQPILSMDYAIAQKGQ